MSVCVRCRVTGRVQGVFFRASTRRQAEELGLNGHAINLPNGDVEVLACGRAGAVEALQDWLWLGPPSAKVQDVQCEAVEVTPPDGFTTG